MRAFLLFAILGSVFVNLAAAQVEVLHRFGYGPVRPSVPLTLGADGALYGITEGDGQTPAARIFRLNSAGAPEIVGKLDGYPYSPAYGVSPLSLDGQGNLWGSTTKGGFNAGIVFRVDSTGTIAQYTSSFGADTVGGIILQSGGHSYGIAQTPGGGSYAYQVDPAGNVIKLKPPGLPNLVLLLTTHTGMMVGMSQASDGGVDFFQLQIDGATSKIAHAAPAIGLPLALTEGASGTLYGITANGGTSGCGAIFSMARGQDAAILVNFSGDLGGGPSGQLALAGDGKLYGTTTGDTQVAGTVFRFSEDGTFETLGSVPGGVGSGAVGLTTGNDGNLYGTTARGGDYGLGAVFRVGRDGAITVLSSFTPYGVTPTGPLIQDGAGNLYGATKTSGPDLETGIIYKISSAGDFKLLALLPADAGSAPLGGVTFGTDGLLYGTTSSGGAHQYGAAFRVGLDGTVAVLGSFDGINAASPSNPLCLGADGSLYGTCGTDQGGVETVFKITSDGAILKVADLDGTTGYGPQGALVAGPDQSLYGMAAAGGAQGGGGIFRVTMAGGVQPATSFSQIGKASGQMAIGADGALYGILGGAVFQWNWEGAPTNVRITGGGKVGTAGLALAGNGRLYGTIPNTYNDSDESVVSDVDVYCVVLGTHSAPVIGAERSITLNPGSSAPIATGDGYLCATVIAEQGCVFRLPIPPNHAPIAQDSRFSVKPGTFTLNVLAGASDSDHDALTITSVTQGAQGSVVINADQTLSYTADPGFSGLDHFTYQITDGHGGTASANVTIYNTVPTAPDIRYDMPLKPAPVTVDVLAVASDPDSGQVLEITVLSAPAYGTATIGQGKVTYTPKPAFTGLDSFSYTVSDGCGGTATGTVRIFDTPLAVAGVYGGTVFSPLAEYLVGPINLTVSKTGNFTASFAGLRVKGTLLPDGTFVGKGTRFDGTYTVHFQIDPVTCVLTGTAVDHTGYTLDLNGAKRVYTAQNPAPQAGGYTFATEWPSVFAIPDKLNPHVGNGYGIMTVSRAGSVRFMGRLGDGAPWSGGANLYGRGVCAFHAQASYPGYLSGTITCSLTFVDSPDSDVTASFSWYRFVATSLEAVNPSTPYYSIDAIFTASRYSASQRPLTIVGQTSNVVAEYDSGPLLEPVDETLSWSARNVIRVDAKGGPRAEFSVDPKTGFFSGSFIDPANHQPSAFSGVCLQKANRASGSFRYPRGFGTVTLTPY